MKLRFSRIGMRDIDSHYLTVTVSWNFSQSAQFGPTLVQVRMPDVLLLDEPLAGLGEIIMLSVMPMVLPDFSWRVFGKGSL